MARTSPRLVRPIGALVLACGCTRPAIDGGSTSSTTGHGTTGGYGDDGDEWGDEWGEGDGYPDGGDCGGGDYCPDPGAGGSGGTGPACGMATGTSGGTGTTSSSGSTGGPWGTGDTTATEGLDDEPPQIQILYPGNGEITGTAFTLSIWASDDDCLDSLELVFNGQSSLLGAVTDYDFDIQGIPVGDWQLIARVTDPTGNTAEAEVTFTVMCS